MPDMKTALESALKEWDTDKNSTTKEDKQMQNNFKVTSNVGRRTFELVKNNPGILPHQITAWGKKEGLNPDSAYAVAAKSVRDGYMVKDSKGGYHAVIPEYKSPKTHTKKKVVAKPAGKGIKALLPTPEVQEALAELAKPKVKHELTNEYILANLSVKQALSLYRELIAIFTGKA